MIELLDWESLKSFQLEIFYMVSAIRNFASAAGCAVMGCWALITLFRQ